MLRFQRSSFNGFQDLFFNHGFRHYIFYSTSIESNPNFVNYLVDNLGFSRKKAISTSSKLVRKRLQGGTKNVNEFDFGNNVDSVVSYLRKIGLRQSEIQDAICFTPQILLCSVDKTLIPKTEALKILGFSESYIAEIVSIKPTVFFSNAFIPAIQALRNILGYNDSHLLLILKRTRRYGFSCIPSYMVPNVAFLHSYGISTDLMRRFVLTRPHIFFRKTDYFRDALFNVEKMLAIPRNSPQLLAGAEVIARLGEKRLESKRQIYKSFGWTDSDVAALFSLNPIVLGLSEDNITKKLNFLMNELGFKPSYLSSMCNLLSCSLEKRIVPRHKILLVLKESGLMTTRSLPSVICYSESMFVKQFVLPYKEVHEVYSKFAGISLEKLTLQFSDSNSGAL